MRMSKTKLNYCIYLFLFVSFFGGNSYSVKVQSRTFDNRMLVSDLPDDATILDLKRDLASRLDVPVDQIRLVSVGFEKLDDVVIKTIPEAHRPFFTILFRKK
jgi:hypothetical protein